MVAHNEGQEADYPEINVILTDAIVGQFCYSILGPCVYGMGTISAKEG